jgi:hypothetical protein
VPRIAIVIGVSTFVSQPSLPACANDAEIMRLILERSQSYEEILTLTAPDQTHSEYVKSQVSSFVSRHKGRVDLEEMLFYFSGHGIYRDGEFFYVLSDFEDARRNKTALKNSELDEYFRTLHPDLAVKVVDACNSGVQYVKDVDNLSGIIRKDLQHSFKKVYFMFSSFLDQKSFADATLSDFTKYFVEAIAMHGLDEIRYRDIIDHLADRFEDNTEQKPFFVMQADSTEVFGLFDTGAKTDLKARLGSKEPPKGDSTGNPKLALADAVKAQAMEYLGDQELNAALRKIPSYIEQVPVDQNLIEIFQKEVRPLENLEGLVNVHTIAKWFEDRKYFGRPIKRVEEYLDYARAIDALVEFSGEQVKKVKKTREVLSGYEIPSQGPGFMRVDVCFEARYINMPDFHIHLLFLFSRREIRYFYSIDELRRGLSGSVQVTHGDWQSLEGRLRNLADSGDELRALFSSIYASIKDRTAKLVGLPEDLPVDATGTPPAATWDPV